MPAPTEEDIRKRAYQATSIELEGWPYPRHLTGRYLAIVMHGDSAGAETLRRSLSDWLTDMCLISAGALGNAVRLARARRLEDPAAILGTPIRNNPASRLQRQG